MQLELEDNDGKITDVSSDNTWKCSTGPIITSDFYMGETFDARLEKAGWDSAGYNDSSWKNSEIAEKPQVLLVSQPSEPVRIINDLAPEKHDGTQRRCICL